MLLSLLLVIGVFQRKLTHTFAIAITTGLYILIFYQCQCHLYPCETKQDQTVNIEFILNDTSLIVLA